MENKSAKATLRIAVFGGTFNPVHNGHINLCLECDKQLGFDKILLVPTKIPPHKEADELASNQDRFNMLVLATRDNPKFEVSDIEYKLEDVSYTINTIKALQAQYINSDIFLLIGSDMLFYFKEWRAYEEILSAVTLVAVAREMDEHEKMKVFLQNELDNSKKILLLDINVLEISSTQIRQRIANGESVERQLDSSVLEYILEHKLYEN